MTKSKSHRMLFVPVLVLVGFIATYCVVEIKKLSNNDIIRELVHDPLLPLIQDMEVAAVYFSGLHQLYNPDSSTKPTQTELLRKPLDDLIRKKFAVSAYLGKDGAAGEEHIVDFDILKRIDLALREVDRNFIIYEGKEKVIWEQSQKNLGLIVDQIKFLKSNVQEARQKTADHLFLQIASDERHRALLLVFVLISGLVLVIVLIDTVYHYKRNAERASAAEKCNALFAAALQNTRVGVLIRDMRREGHPVVFINSAFTRMTGYSFDDVIGETSEFMFGWKTAPEAITSFRRAVHLQETTILDVLLYRKDGSPFWSEWHLTPLMGEDGKLSYFVSLLNDTTGLRQTQDDLIQAKYVAEHASAVKSTFLAMMSHEIRTPINGILGIFKLLEETKLDEEQNHLIGIAKTSSRVLHGIINDILDYAKMEAGKIEIVPEPFEVRVLIEELAGLGRSLLGEKPVDFDFDVHESCPAWMVGDVGRLRQIILNLMSNAIKFTEMGFVRIRVYPLLAQDVDGKPGHLMRFEVQDTGLGIGVEDQDKLFQEFSQVDRTFTRRFGGTGLGLAICRRLIILMNGEINVESQPGKGSRFWFILPLQITTAPLEVAPVSVPFRAAGRDMHQHKATLRILLVEDNETNRLVAHKYVEKLGLAVDEACDGKQAIEMAKAISYDVILMDVSMPVMDGLMATHHIRALDEHNAAVPIIALTAHAMEGDRQLCLAAGMNDYLNKPLNFNQLTKILERWLSIELAIPVPVNTREVSAQSMIIDQQQAMDQRPSDEVGASLYSKARVFDSRVLRSMHQELGGPVVRQVTQVYLQDSARRIESLYQTEKLDEYRDIAHTLKSCSANCGLMKFSALMAELERLSSDNNADAVRKLLGLVKTSYEESRHVLEKEREQFMN